LTYDIPEYPPGNADISSDVPVISFYVNIYFKFLMNIKYPWVIFYDDIEVMATKPTNISYRYFIWYLNSPLVISKLQSDYT